MESSRSESSDSKSSTDSYSSGESETGAECESDSNQSDPSYRRRKNSRVIRPGFQGSTRLDKVNYRTPLKITMTNDKISEWKNVNENLIVKCLNINYKYL